MLTSKAKVARSKKNRVLQTSFGHIFINSLIILMVLIGIESPLLINTSHISRQLVLAEILSRSIDNYYSTVY